MNASIIFGNPKTPYSGSGIFDLRLGTIPLAAQQVPVGLRTTGSNLMINIDATTMETMVKESFPNIYAQIKAGHLRFDAGSLPFYINNEVRSALWGSRHGTDYVCITPQSPVVVAKGREGDISIIVSGIMHGNGLMATPPGEILPKYGMLSSGSWKIGADLYGNLCFSNGVCRVILSAMNDNADNYALSFNGRIASQDAGSIVGISYGGGLDTTQKVYCVGAWNIGVDQYGNLTFTNGLIRMLYQENSIVGSAALCINNSELDYGVTKNGLTLSKNFGNNRQITIGKWTIAEDTDGNLCFYNDLKGSDVLSGHFFSPAPVTVDASKPDAPGCVFIDYASYIHF